MHVRIETQTLPPCSLPPAGVLLLLLVVVTNA